MLQGPEEVRRVRLVRRGDARRRSRARDGSGRAHPLSRRCRLQRSRARRATEQHRGEPPGEHRLELVGQPGRGHPAPTRSSRSTRSRCRRWPRASACTSSSGDDGDEVGERATARARLPGVRPVGHRGRRDEPRDRRRTARPRWRRAGRRARATSRPVRTRRRRRAPSCTDRVAERARSSTNPHTSKAWCPTRSRSRTVRRLRAFVPDISMLGDPNTGMLVGQTQKFKGEGKPHYDQYRIGGTSLSSPLFAGVMALADDMAGGRARLREPVALRRSARPGTVNAMSNTSTARSCASTT